MRSIYKILRVKRTNLYDIFQGEGWKEWTRVRVDSGKLEVVSGEKLSTYQSRMLIGRINKLVKNVK